MCLFAKTNEIKVAEDDIKCYKVINVKKVFNDYVFLTPYQLVEVDIDTLLGQKPFSADRKPKLEKFKDDVYVAEGGFIHAFKHYEDALDDCDYCDIVFECIIKKGTKYIEGVCFENVGIAAESVMFNPYCYSDKESLYKFVENSFCNRYMEREIIIIRGKKMHIVIGVDPNSIEKDDNLWDISFEDFLVGAVDINEDIWYVYSDGRLYETFESVEIG